MSTKYYLRAECPYDIKQAINVLANCSKINKVELYYYNPQLWFETKLDIDVIKQKLKLIDDSHRMIETLCIL